METCIALHELSADRPLPLRKGPTTADLEVMDPEARTKLAMTLKQKGNKLYSAKKFSEAVVQYTKAIECEEQAVFYSNRAACESSISLCFASSPSGSFADSENEDWKLMRPID